MSEKYSDLFTEQLMAANSDNRQALAWLEHSLNAIGGCSDACCMVKPPEGQHTNGGCRCWRDPFKVQKTIRAYDTFKKMIRTI
jgi:hypothetical protein